MGMISFTCMYSSWIIIIILIYLLLISLAGFCFLSETLHKSKSKWNKQSPDQSHDQSLNESSDSESDYHETDIEMVSLTNGSESELTNGIVESDLSTDVDVSLTDESDTELLITKDTVHVQQQPLHWKIRNKMKRSLDPISLGKRFLHHHKEQCIECCYCCSKETCLSLIHNRTGSLNLNQRIFSKLKLLIDRCVIVSVLLYGFLGFVAVMSNEVKANSSIFLSFSLF